MLDWQPVLVAAGSSSRFGETNKLLELIEGLPAVVRSLMALRSVPAPHALIAVVSADTRQALSEWAESSGLDDLVMVDGGKRRRDSVEAALRLSKANYVAVHDAARPLVSPELVIRVLGAAIGNPGAVPAVPVTDSIAKVGSGSIVAHIPRGDLRILQTPQVVRRSDWLRAASMDAADVTDESSMLARLGLACVLVEGERSNLKLTTASDLVMLRALAAQESSNCSE